MLQLRIQRQLWRSCSYSCIRSTHLVTACHQGRARNTFGQTACRPCRTIFTSPVLTSNDHQVTAADKEAASNTTTAASLGQLWQILRPERGRLQLALGALCASSSVNLSYPYFMGRIVDLFGDGGEGLNFVLDHTLTCGGLIVFGGFATFCRLYLIETAIERIGFRLRHELFRALIHRPIAFFDNRKTGELINRLGNDITVTSRVLIDVSAGIRSAITASVATFMVFKLAPTEMIAGLLAPVAATFVVGVGYGRLVRRIAERRQNCLADSMTHAEERLAGIRTVRTFNAETRELRNFEALLDKVYSAGRHSALASGGLSGFFVTAGGIFLLHIIYNCGLMVTSGVVTIGTTVSLGVYCFMAGASYTGLMTAYGDVQKCLGACTKVLEIVDVKAAASTQVLPMMSQQVAAAVSIASHGAAQRLSTDTSTQPLAVRFEGVSFSYPSRPEAPVLQGLDLDIPSGSRVALLGRSGSGKSTVAVLLAGLYEPSAGRILVDDKVVNESTGAWVRSQIGVISQDPTLFALSIKENVEYGMEPGATHESDVNAAILAAHVEDFTKLLPQGLETPAGERGQSLSGGQKQRVCIARALAKRPRMLVFDEATSALDLQSERLVHNSLKDLLSSGDCSCLVITHRMSALEWVDRVAVVHEGRIVQYGLKEDVLRSPCEALQIILRSNAGRE
eukprot:TRINITY_DN32256_c0_g1_i1.p1 TRINITY_DN32256_c0_g1~~TRINITY_DN32256_c0_g1_i1.p1  ORF type:complete len:679 (+),score=69.21 TRINITY_DN32256_c0_g1_i1:44-2080(+)